MNSREPVLSVDHEPAIEQQKEEENLEYKQLLTAISSILIGLDESSTIKLWNKSAENIFQLSFDEVRHKTLGQIAISCEIQAITEAIKECRENNQVVRTSEIAYTRADGNAGFLGFSLSPINPDKNSKLSVLLVGADITAKKDMEKQLLHAQKLESIGQLSAGIAHEINTPIQYVGDNINFLSDSFSELASLVEDIKQMAAAAKENSQEPDMSKKILAAMETTDIDYLLEEIPAAIAQSKEGVFRVSKIVNAMKEFSHGSDNKVNADINRAINSTIIVAQSEWKNVAQIETTFEENLPMVPCFLSEVNQVILNMIINAVHAIEDTLADKHQTQGLIKIATRTLNDSVEISISDSGSGIPEAIKNRVFDPFFTTKEVGKGSGQGLSIAYDVITRKHGGTISVNSRHGEGTTFIISLPLEPDETITSAV